MSLPRVIKQPGPPRPKRIVAVEAGMIAIEAEIGPCPSLVDGLHALLARYGVVSACLRLEGGALSPFAYVMPALSPDATRAAFYSDVYRPPGEALLDAAALTFGRRDSRPFFHCHALWSEASGRRNAGHVLPEATGVARAIRVTGAGLIGACFEVAPDAETGFSLFGPVATDEAMPAHAQRAVALRLCPNLDVTLALEEAGRAAGFRHAATHGGVASFIGVRFTDAPPIEGFATEVFLRAGRLRCGDASGAPSRLQCAGVDFKGAIGEGSLVRGDNPVLMTFEGLIAEAGESMA